MKCGATMFSTDVLLKIKEVKTGSHETRINSSFLEVVHDLYMAQIRTWIRCLKMIPEIAFGNHTRVVLDVGCGVASCGAFLMS